MNVLAIGAHHADVEFGCFGTLTRHRQNNDKVVVAVMSNGALKHSVNDDVIRTPARSELETEQAMSLIGKIKAKKKDSSNLIKNYFIKTL